MRRAIIERVCALIERHQLFVQSSERGIVGLHLFEVRSI